MAEIKEFVVNDRRKFTAAGDLRPDAPPSEPKPPRPETIQPVAPPPVSPEKDEFDSSAKLATQNGPQAVPDKAPANEDDFPPPPTAEQSEQATRAYDATVDLMGARQSVDMLAVIAEKSKGNLSTAEEQLLQSALFEMRMGFLEITQALARQAAAKHGAAPGASSGPSGPSIVR